MLYRSARVFFIFGIALSLLLFLVLVITGFPKPVKLTVNESIPRIPWIYSIENAYDIHKTYNDPYFVSLLPDHKGAIVASRSGLFSRSLFYQESDSAKLSKIDGMPEIERLIQVTPTGNGLDLLFLMKDETKSLQLYHYKQSEKAYNRVKTTNAGVDSYIYKPGDSIVFFNSKIKEGDRVVFKIYQIDLERDNNIDIVFSSHQKVRAVDWRMEYRYLLIKHDSANEVERLELLKVGKNNIRSKFSIAAKKGEKYQDPSLGVYGKYIFYLSSRDSDFTNVHRLSIQDKLDTCLTQSISWDVEEFAILPNNELIVNINEDGFSNLLKTNSEIDNLHKIASIPWGNYQMIRHPGANRLSLNIIQGYDKKIMCQIDLDKQECELWNNGTSPFGRKKYPRPELIKYPSFDPTINKPLILSAIVYKKLLQSHSPRPVIIKIHGGPPQQSRPYYSLDSKILEDGVVLIEPNLRGSTGYGKKFEKLDNALMRHHSVDDIGALLDWIAGQSDLDETRVAITGGSYGGYLVLASLIKYGERLSCGINNYGISSFVNLIENTEARYLEAVRNEYGDERQQIDRMYLKEISPINRIKEIKSPLFIYHGAGDNLIKIDQSRKVYSALRGNNLNIWYIEASNEGHGLRDPWNFLFIEGAQYLFLKENLHFLK